MRMRSLLLLGLVGLLGSVTAPPARAADSAVPPARLTVYFTSEVRGNLKPCG